MGGEFDFDDNDVDDAYNKDLLPLCAFVNGVGLIKSVKILHGRSSAVPRNVVVPKIEEDRISDTLKVVSPYFKHTKGAMAPPSTETALSLASATWSLF